MSELVKIYYFYIDPDSGNGDLIFNTCKKIIDDNDRSDWAYCSHMLCEDCLLSGKRWPDYMNESVYITTTNHRQDEMTRDPYILYYATTIFLYPFPEDYISRVKIPLRLFNIGVFSWRKYLITHNRIYLNLYRISRWFNGLWGQPYYVQRLNYYMDKAIRMTES